jgi:hypothetical protein
VFDLPRPAVVRGLAPGWYILTYVNAHQHPPNTRPPADHPPYAAAVCKLPPGPPPDTTLTTTYRHTKAGQSGWYTWRLGRQPLLIVLLIRTVTNQTVGPRLANLTQAAADAADRDIRPVTDCS